MTTSFAPLTVAIGDLTAHPANVRGSSPETYDLYEADSDFRYGAEAPDNPATTMRVLTIMLARDW